MFKKIMICVLALSLILGLSTFAFGEKTKLVVLTPSAWLSTNVLEPLEQAFEEEHPDIDLIMESVAVSEYQNAVVMRGAANDLPDVFMQVTDSRFDNFVDAGLMLPLNVLLQELNIDISQYPKVLFDNCKRNGILYAFPKAPLTRGTVNYNRDLFREAGLPDITKDTTWTEFRDVLKKLVVKDEDGNVTRYGGLSKYPYFDLAYLFGARIVDDPWKPTKVRFGDDDFVNAMKEFVEMTETGELMPFPVYQALGGSKPQIFIEQKVALVITVMNWKGGFQDAPFDWDIELIPGPDGVFGGAHTTTIAWAVSSTSENPKDAMEWIRWLILSETALRVQEAQWQSNKEPIPYAPELLEIYAEIADQRKPKNWRALLIANEHVVFSPAFKDSVKLTKPFYGIMGEILRGKAEPEDLRRVAAEVQEFVDSLNF